MYFFKFRLLGRPVQLRERSRTLFRTLGTYSRSQKKDRPKNIFSSKRKIILKTRKIWKKNRKIKMLKFQGISLRFPLCNNMLLHNGNLKEIPWNFNILIFLFFFQIFLVFKIIFLFDEKIFFGLSFFCDLEYVPRVLKSVLERSRSWTGRPRSRNLKKYIFV